MDDGVSRKRECLEAEKVGFFVEPHGYLKAIRLISVNSRQQQPAWASGIGNRKHHTYLSFVPQYTAAQNLGWDEWTLLSSGSEIGQLGIPVLENIRVHHSYELANRKTHKYHPT